METSNLSENRILIQHLMRQVNDFSQPRQLQHFRLLQFSAGAPHKYVILLQFYPALRGAEQMVIEQDPEAGVVLNFLPKKPSSEWSTKVHPLSLYVKSHLVGKRCQRWELTEGGDSLKLSLHFEGVGVLRLGASAVGLACEVEIAGRKTFRKEIGLGPWRQSSAVKTPTGATQATPSAGSLDKKHGRLLANVEKDRASARQWLEDFHPLLALLEADPSAWGREGVLAPELRELLQKEHQQQRLPAFQPQTRGEALEILFHRRRRMERKRELADRRWEQVQREISLPPPSRPPLSSFRKISAPSGPGLCLEVVEGLQAWIGKSASDNDALFRRFRDRDLWFHARGVAGAHVWIPRGQKAWPRKMEAGEKIYNLGGQLALINSKYRAQAEGEVDIAERRFLKKGASPGEVMILQSKVRRFKIDEAFERRLFPKKVGTTP